VRFSSGGLRFLQAKGFLVQGLAQVSMNLTDFTQTAGAGRRARAPRGALRRPALAQQNWSD
jgi:hypothetical protein